MNKTNPTIALVAGEVSGDILGAGLIRQLKAHYPNARFIGIAGPRMLAEGCETLVDMEELSVMGLAEILKHLPRLLKIRKNVIQTMLQEKPDVYIGIDAPDFNLDVELKLKANGIKTIHYVSPSVWAWRQNRIHKIAKATHQVLAFLPFEKAFYDKFNVPCRFIGHTMADAIPLKPNRAEACQILQIDPAQRYLAILVGSRGSEVEFLAEPFLKTALLLKEQFPDLQFLVPLVNEKRRIQFEAIKAKIAPNLDLHLIDGNARQAMIAADATLLASGTAALEAMLCKSPMVVGYRMKPLTYFLAKRLVKTDYISLPNLLANEMLVPEMIQEECVPELLAEKLSTYLSDDESAVKNLNDFIKAQKTNSPWFAYLDLALEAKNSSDYERTLQDIDSLLAKALEATPLENTLVIITSEHGVTFNEMNEKERENYFGRDEVQVPLLVYWKDLPVGKQNGLSNHADIFSALMQTVFRVENPLMDYSQGRNLFDLKGDDWVLASNFHWNVVIQPDGTQYHIDRKGNYKKFDKDYIEQSSDRPPLGIFLEAFQLQNFFFEK